MMVGDTVDRMSGMEGPSSDTCRRACGGCEPSVRSGGSGSLLLCGVVLALVTVFAPRGLVAEDGPSPDDLSKSERAKFARLLNQGKEAYVNENFEEAVPNFQKAYEVLPVPGLLYRIAQSYDRSGAPAKALGYYRKYLEERPESSKREKIEKKIEELENEVGATLRIASEPDRARVHVGSGDSDETFRGLTPVTLDVDPGEVEVTIRKKDYLPKNETVEVEAGAETRVDWKMEPTEPNTVPIILTTVGGIGAVATGVLYGIGRNCQMNPSDCTPEFYRPIAVSSYASALVTAGTLGTATFMWISRSSSSTERRAEGPTIQPQVSFAPLGLGISGRF